jgi:hypothetical protein
MSKSKDLLWREHFDVYNLFVEFVFRTQTLTQGTPPNYLALEAALLAHIHWAYNVRYFYRLQAAWKNVDGFLYYSVVGQD